MSDSILQRWSKRKALSEIEQKERNQLEPREDAAPAAENQIQAVDTETAADQTEAETTEEQEKKELPDLDSLGPDSDYSAFLSQEVDEKLKKMAFRKLFMSPFFNIRDGLDDYDDDFTTFEALGDIVTSDMKYHAERKRLEKEQQEREQMETQEPDDIDTLAQQESAAEKEQPETEQPLDETQADAQVAANNSQDESTAT